MKNINMSSVVVNEEVVRSIQQLCTVKDKTFDEMVAHLLEHAVKDVCYRMKRNQQKWQETKNMKAKLAELEAQLQK